MQRDDNVRWEHPEELQRSELEAGTGLVNGLALAGMFWLGLAAGAFLHSLWK